MCRRRSMHPSSPPPSCCRHAASAARTVPLPLKKPKTRMTCTPRRACSARLNTTCARASIGGVAGGRAALQVCSVAWLPARPSLGSATEVHCACRCLGGKSLAALMIACRHRRVQPSNVWPHRSHGAALGRACVSFHQCMLSRLYWLVPLKYLQAAEPRLTGRCIRRARCAGGHRR